MAADRDGIGRVAVRSEVREEVSVVVCGAEGSVDAEEGRRARLLVWYA